MSISTFHTSAILLHMFWKLATWVKIECLAYRCHIIYYWWTMEILLLEAMWFKIQSCLDAYSYSWPCWEAHKLSQLHSYDI